MQQLFGSPDSVASEPVRSLHLIHQTEAPSERMPASDQKSDPKIEWRDRDRILKWLEQQVPASRLHHILRVEQLAIALAEHHQLNVLQAAQAGLMHDLAKYFKPQRLIEMATAAGMVVDPVEAANPHLLHADVGAIVAEAEFGMEDPEVLAAIRNHTVGRPNMSPLSCIVFLADSLEPGRGNTPALNTLRQVSWDNLYQAVWLTCDYTLQYLLSSRCLVHPRAIQTRNWAMQQTTQSRKDRPTRPRSTKPVGQ